jgi:proline dehydrogenase
MKIKKAIAQVLTKIAQHAASSYIVGSELSDAQSLCIRLAARGWRSTICPWDMVGTPAREVFDSYLAAVRGIAGMQCDCYLSIKVPSLAYDEGMLTELVACAASDVIRVHLDALAPDTVEKSLRLVTKLRANYSNLGWTLPSRWQRSTSDLEQVQDLEIPVRIVKGQWEDPFGGEQDARAGFQSLIEALARSGRSLCAVATHDAALARESIERLRLAGVPCELEQLFGLPRAAESAAVANEVPVRVYIPYSYGYLPYALSNLIAQPHKVWWLLRDSLRQRMRY